MIVLYAGLTWLNTILNNPAYTPQTPAAKKEDFALLTTRLIRLLKLVVALRFAYLLWGTVQVAQQWSAHLWPLLLPAIIISFVILIGWHLIQYRKISKANAV